LHYEQAPEAHVHGILAFAHTLLQTWVLDLVWEAPSPSLLEQCVPLDSSLYFSRTEIDPEISKVLLATNCLFEEFCPLLWASLTLA
jgi:hypothetical protein